MATNGSRFHIEINSIKVDDMAVRFNIFGDTLAQVTADLEQVIAYVTGQADIKPQLPPSAPWVAPALNAPVPSVAPKAAAPAAKPARTAAQAPAKPPALTGACCACGSDALEWVTGTRKDNGKSFAAYKCQECGKWQPEAKS
jgi:hypothetical protein